MASENQLLRWLRAHSADWERRLRAELVRLVEGPEGARIPWSDGPHARILVFNDQVDNASVYTASIAIAGASKADWRAWEQRLKGRLASSGSIAPTAVVWPAPDHSRIYVAAWPGTDGPFAAWEVPILWFDGDPPNQDEKIPLVDRWQRCGFLALPGRLQGIAREQSEGTLEFAQAAIISRIYRWRAIGLLRAESRRRELTILVSSAGGEFAAQVGELSARLREFQAQLTFPPTASALDRLLAQIPGLRLGEARSSGSPEGVPTQWVLEAGDLARVDPLAAVVSMAGGDHPPDVAVAPEANVMEVAKLVDHLRLAAVAKGGAPYGHEFFDELRAHHISNILVAEDVVAYYRGAFAGLAIRLLQNAVQQMGQHQANSSGERGVDL